MTQVTDTAMLTMLFKNLQEYVPYAACFPALPKKFLRELLKVTPAGHPDYAEKQGAGVCVPVA